MLTIPEKLTGRQMDFVQVMIWKNANTNCILNTNCF